MRLFVAWVGVAVAVGAACGNPAGDSVDGSQIFQSVCAACHGPTGKPDAALVARLGVKDLTAPELRDRVTVELVENQVHNGSKNKLMPSFDGALTDAQIRAVAVYVASAQFLLLAKDQIAKEQAEAAAAAKAKAQAAGSGSAAVPPVGAAQ